MIIAMIKYLQLTVILAMCLCQIKSAAQSTYLTEIGKHDSLYSNVLNENKDFWVQYPEFFNPELKYPVVFILDGGRDLPTVVNTHKYYSGGFFPEMIMIGISNAENRTRDLTTSKVTNRRGRPFRGESGGAEAFMEFLKSELIPYVEQNFPVTNYRTLIGHSYGGQFAINALLNHTEVFHNYLAIDPSLDWDNQKLLKKAKQILAEKRFDGRSLFMSLGGQLHMQNNQITIENVMQDTSEYTLFSRSNIELSQLIESNNSNGLKSTWRFYKDDLHGTVSLPSIIDGLKYFFTWYPIEGTDKFNDPATPIQVLVDLVKSRARKLESNFGYVTPPFDESLFNMLGFMNMDMGNPEKSLTFFNMAIKYYPNSASAYDSVADYYIAEKNYQEALKNVKKAYQISGSEFHQKRIDIVKAMK